ncbi:MAG: hypothetical protein ACKVW3_01605 [Phycisphaerales bacterium]
MSELATIAVNPTDIPPTDFPEDATSNDTSAAGSPPAGAPDETATLRSELAKTKDSLRVAELRRAIDRELYLAGAIDIASAAMLTEAAVSGLSAPDAAAAVRELRRRRPGLFRAPPAPGGASMGPASGPGDSDADRAKAAASASGDRKALLQYLRARRTA